MEHSSIDRHVESDTRFSRGMWELKNGVTIRWAQSSFKTTSTENSIHNLSATIPLRGSRGASLNNPTITTELTHSNIEGVINVEHYHHVSRFKSAKQAKFQVNKPTSPKELTDSVKVVSNDNFTTLSDNNISAEIQKENWGLNFRTSENKLLTKLGFRSVGWVTDERFTKDIKGVKTPSTYTTIQLHISNGEKFFGLGERFGPYVKNGQRVEIWNEDGGTSSEWAYKNIPFLISNRGYGVFINTPTNVTFEIQSERTTRINITVPTEGINYYIINGPDPKTILHRYAQLTGFPALPPPETFGLWLSTSFTTNYDITTVKTFIEGMLDRDIPLSFFHFDCFWMKGFQWCDFEFDPEFFPDPKQMLAELKRKYGVKICVWINPYVAQEAQIFAEGDKNGYFIKNLDGTSYQTDLWQAGMGIVDFTNPEAVKWYQSFLAKLIDLGVDSFKTDFGERIPIQNVKYHNGQDPVSLHNYYSYLYNKAVWDILESKKGKHEAALFARSATVGGQQFPVHWGGDCESTFEAMAETIRGGLSFALSGFGFWSHDISGFEQLAPWDVQPDAALYKRWCAFGLLSSHSRLHGSGSYRVPWNFDDESSEVLSKFTHLKLSLMPYIYNSAIQAHTLALPVLRPLILEYFSDYVAQSVDNAYFLGDAFYVAPITNPEGEIDFYLPKGQWYGYLDGKIRSSSGEYFNEVHDFKSLPLLVKQNSIFVSSGGKHTDAKYDYSNDVIINIFELDDGEYKVEIPSFEKLGEIETEFKVTQNNGKLKINLVSGRANKISVKLLGVSNVAGVSNGDFSFDEFNNSLISVDGSSTEIKL
ncbi:hypothetical protein WICMUC_000468 [Wickerhamomyces mucosus]|uniref:alpha-D-xyloside xylohydrolase n=1 Tax=Wickerhamomyces mucosus TaxID=1378264 RepID=A0A9P8PXD4_9ASCO|nr:hypothetical protein WICMUC_000468 [Wickerhamomyces mucosus]